MTDVQQFLNDFETRPVTLQVPAGWHVLGLILGEGPMPLEVVIVTVPARPSLSDVRTVWKARLAGRATGLLLAVLDDGPGSALWSPGGPAAGQPHTIGRVHQATRLDPIRRIDVGPGIASMVNPRPRSRSSRRAGAWGARWPKAAEALEENSETAADIESLPLEPGRSSVVRLMNLPRAKGLEAPIVFLGDPCGDRWRHVSKGGERDADGARGWFCIERDVEGYGNRVIAQPAGWD